MTWRQCLTRANSNDAALFLFFIFKITIKTQIIFLSFEFLFQIIFLRTIFRALALVRF